MMPKVAGPNRRPSPKPKAAPGLAGAGGGTLLVLLTKLLPDEYAAWKQAAIYIAPSLSVGIAVFLVWLRDQVADYLNEKLKNRLFDQAQSKLQKMLNDPNTSPELREELTGEIDSLQRLRMKSVLDIVYRKV